jgi:hypothetical protein
MLILSSRLSILRSTGKMQCYRLSRISSEVNDFRLLPRSGHLPRGSSRCRLRALTFHSDLLLDLHFCLRVSPTEELCRHLFTRHLLDGAPFRIVVVDGLGFGRERWQRGSGNQSESLQGTCKAAVNPHVLMYINSRDFRGLRSVLYRNLITA